MTKIVLKKMKDCNMIRLLCPKKVMRCAKLQLHNRVMHDPIQ